MSASSWSAVASPPQRARHRFGPGAERLPPSAVAADALPAHSKSRRPLPPWCARLTPASSLYALTPDEIKLVEEASK
jgi:hypothetical protein